MENEATGVAVITKEERTAYVMILPALAILIILVGYPLFRSFWLSMSNIQVGQKGDFVGFRNFIMLTQSETFRKTLVNSLIYMFTAVSGKLTLGLVLALILEKVTRGRKIFRGIILLPWVVPICLSTLAWLWMFDPLYSVINWTLMKLDILHQGQGIPWLSEPFWARTAIIIVNIWRGLPFFAIILLAGLLSIPKDFTEAAKVDGAGPIGVFWHVTLPLIFPLLGIVVLYSIIMTIADFDIVYVLTRGGPINTTHLFATLAFQEGIASGDISGAAAISLFIFPFLGASAYLQLRIMRRRMEVL